MTPRAILYGDELARCYAEELARCSAFDIATACLGLKAVQVVEGALRDALRRGVTGRFLVGLDMPSDPAAIRLLAGIAGGSGGRLGLRVLRASD
jgi:hypothetical protein